MADITGEKSPANRRANVSRVWQRGATVAWTSWLLSVGLLWLEERLWVLHPWPILLLLLVTVTAGAVLITLALGFWRVLRGPGRRTALAWTLIALIPVLFWVSSGLYA